MASGTRQDYINTMSLAAQEIRSLRRTNEILSAQMDVVTIFAAALGLRRDNIGMGEDIAYRLEKHIEAIQIDIERELKKEEANKAKPLAAD